MPAPEGELWSTLVTAVDPGNLNAMPAVLESTISLLETELAKARAALRELQPNAPAISMQGDEFAVGAVAAYREHLIGRAPEFFYGARRLSPKEVGLVPVVRELQSGDDETEELFEQSQGTPRRTSLVDVLSNSLVLDRMAPYLSAASLLALASTSRFLRIMIIETPYIFRHLDLTQCHGAQMINTLPVGPARDTRRNELLDETLTEDEFYSGPLRRIFANLEQRSILQDVRTLVLDGLSVPADLVADIVLTERFNINILSIRDCRHLNERKLMQILQYAARPERPKGTPRVKDALVENPVAELRQKK
ncbi:hypothetical protein EYZ11_003254 [Aspergillus tanneri]|uniref:F-box domain-containing protein n=1 Tax=Aspergillus tanneri TaxID=1220188 RepID=A0A4S3JNS8_9EURO|nr:hypothetical protein EYZ11_003254 [Aspergillus tanneri]